MPSFDVVSELDSHEVSNALDQANREVITRYDFKGTTTNCKSCSSSCSTTACVELIKFS